MITTQELNSGTLLFLPLCPSTNRRTQPVRMGRFAREILTAEARAYIANVGTALRWAWRKRAPIDAYRKLEIWLVLPRTNCDNHNFFKVLMDALEAGGVVTNDKYLMPRVMGVWHDAKNPEVVIKI